LPCADHLPKVVMSISCPVRRGGVCKGCKKIGGFPGGNVLRICSLLENTGCAHIVWLEMDVLGQPNRLVGHQTPALVLRLRPFLDGVQTNAGSPPYLVCTLLPKEK